MMNVDAVLAAAAGQVGYKEGRNNDNKFGAWYPMNNQPWCAMFVSWAFAQAGAEGALPGGKRFAYCPSGVNAARAVGRFNRTPGVGAVVFYDWNGDGLADHVGIVEKVLSGEVQTLEGNTSAGAAGSQSNGDGVWRRRRPLTHIQGFFHPAYEGAPDPVPSAPEQGRNLTTRPVGDIQRLVGADPDGIYGPGTTAKVKAWQGAQGLEADGVWGSR